MRPMKRTDSTNPRRGASGHRKAEEAVTRQERELHANRQREEMDEVDLASDYSFPASDPPAWTGGQSRRRREASE